MNSPSNEPDAWACAVRFLAMIGFVAVVVVAAGILFRFGHWSAWLIGLA